ncbi:ogr/Delta-like zinc finger family protein, partial [Pseudomonas aeruginosa]|uniref:ogr/Delta-like zinc finger family protein n=1 Tax=Pseudomonas aeruginosa TaxID=287 RepID=UPI00301575E6
AAASCSISWKIWASWTATPRRNRMKIECPKCGGKARIYTRQKVTSDFCKLYCQCLDTKACHQRFVMNLSLSHCLERPETVLDELVHERLRGLSVQQIKEMQDRIERTAI